MQPVQASLLPADFPPPASLEAPRARKAERPVLSAEDIFAQQCTAYRLPSFERQTRFAKAIGRQWQFDFAFPTYHVAVEIEGLVPKILWEAKLGSAQPITQDGLVINVTSVERTFVVLGRHASITGIIEDMEKYNSAAMFGWTVLRFAAKNVKPRHAIEMTMRVLAARGWKPEVTS